MRGLLLLALAVLVGALAPPGLAGASTPVPSASPDIEVRVVSFAPPPTAIACAEGQARFVEGEAVPPRIWQLWKPRIAPVGGAPYVPPPPPTSEVYTFSVDLQGHVTDLKRTAIPNTPIYWPTDEQAAIIASWRFAPGAAARDCRLDLAPTHAAIAETSPARLFQILGSDPRNAAPAVRKALSADGDCDRGPRRRPQVMVYPDLRPFDDKSVDPSWTVIRYDIDASGAARDVRIAAQHGQAAFADTAAGAISESRFFPGPPRKGCLAAFRAEPQATEAPPRPAGESFERPTDDCKVTREALNIPETKTYPPPFGKRRVAGWAILRFDVAPWGQVGAVEILASQPAAQFGEAARMLLQGARPSPPATGYRGCVVPMIYAIPAIDDGDS